MTAAGERSVRLLGLWVLAALTRWLYWAWAEPAAIKPAHPPASAAKINANKRTITFRRTILAEP